VVWSGRIVGGRGSPHDGRGSVVARGKTFVKGNIGHEDGLYFVGKKAIS